MNTCPNPEQCREEAEWMFNPHAKSWDYIESCFTQSGQGVCHAIPKRIKGEPFMFGNKITGNYDSGNKIMGGYRLGIRFNSSLRASNPPAKPVGLLARIRAALGFKS